MALLPTARLLPCLLLLLTLTLQLSSSAPSRNRTVSSSSRGRGGSKAGRTRGRTPAPGVVIAQRSPCSALVDGRLIDLTQLGDTHFTPSYSVEVGGWTYSFNPCFPFNVPENPYTGLEDQCDFVAMCQSKMTSEGHVAYTMGIQQTASFVLYQPPGEPAVTSPPVEVTSQGDAVVWIDSGTEKGVDSREDNSEDTIEDNEEGEEGEDGEENEEDDEQEETEGEGEGELTGEGEEEENRKGGVVHKRGGGLDVSEEQEDEDTETEEGSGQDNDDEDDDDDDNDSGDDDDDDDDSGDDDDDSGDDDDYDDEEDGQDENEDTTKTDVETSTPGQRRRQKLRGRETTRKRRYKRDIKEPSKKANKRRRGRKRKRPTPSVALSSVNSSLVQVDDRITQGLSVEPTTRRVSVRKGGEVVSTTRRPKYDTVGTEKKGERSKKRRTSARKSKEEKSLPVSRMPRGTPALKLSGIRSLRRQRTFVLLVCDTKRLPGDRADFTFLRRQHRTLYFELRHVCCCPDACTTTVLRTSASRDQLSETEKEAGASFWPPHQLLWVVVAVFVIIFAAIVIGTACCRTGGAKGPYTMLPGLHSSRLTMSSMDSVRMQNKFPSPDYLDYTSPKLKQAQLPQVDNGIVLSHELEIGQRLGGGLFGDTYIGEFRDHNISAKRITVGVHKGQLTEVDRALLVDHISHFSTLQHKHIVQVIGICLDTRQPHVIKEYVDGESLRMLLQHNTDGGLTYSRKLRMLTQAADGMTYLHSSKVSVLHRDLRCANLLISKADDHVKITDFGMVRLLHRLRVQCTGREGCYCRKSTPSFPASIRWTAPEVLRHPASEETLSEVFGPPCDVYSFGMTLWEAVNASDPWYEMPREEDVMDAVLRGGRPEETLNEGTPDVHVGLMKACWLEDPTKRPSFKQIHSHLSSLVKQVAKEERRHQRRDSESSTMTYFRSALNISTQ